MAVHTSDMASPPPARRGVHRFPIAVRLAVAFLAIFALGAGCVGEPNTDPSDTDPADVGGAHSPIISYSGVVGGPSGWTLSGAVTGAGTGSCCGTYTDSSGGSYPVMFRMVPTSSTPASATKVITGLTPKSVYTVAVKMKGNHWQVPPTLAITGGAQIVKAHSYMDPADENQWRERSFIVYTDAASTSLTLVLSVYSNTLGATGEFALPRVYAGLPAVPAPEIGQPAFVATPARPAAPTAGQNLIMDPTWSATTGSPWAFDAATFSGTGTTRLMKLTPTASINARAQQLIPMWLAPSTTYTLRVRAGVTVASPATIYAYYADDGTNVITSPPYVFNITNVVSGTISASSLPVQTFTFTTRARYSQIKLYFEKYHGMPGDAYFAELSLAATGNEWTDTPWTTPPATTTGFTDYFTSGLDPQRWLIADKQWGGDNGGVYHTNVRRRTGGGIILEAHGDTYVPDAAHAADPRGGRRVGAAIVTRNYYASGLYEVRAKIPPNLGACTAFWPFHYIGYSNGDAGYWAEPSPIRNTEIDWEMPTDYVPVASTGIHSAISFNYQRENNWGGQWGGEGGESSLRNIGTSSIADGAFHTFGIRWKSGTDTTGGLRTPGTVEWLLDGAVVRTFTGATFGQDNVPFRGARFWIGIWFPASGYHRLTSAGTYTDSVGWAGDPSFSTAQLEIQWVRITPISQNRDRWVSETSPSGFYATPNQYP